MSAPKRFWGSWPKKILHDSKARSQMCGAERVTAENLVRFAQVQPALDQKFRLCKRCFADVYAERG